MQLSGPLSHLKVINGVINTLIDKNLEKYKKIF